MDKVPDGVCFMGSSGKLYLETTVWRTDSAARTWCEQRALECVPRREREGGRPVPVCVSHC